MTQCLCVAMTVGLPANVIYLNAGYEKNVREMEQIPGVTNEAANEAPRSVAALDERCLSPTRFLPGIDTTGHSDVSQALMSTEARASALGIPMCIAAGTYLVTYWHITHAGLVVQLDPAAVLRLAPGKSTNGGAGSGSLIRIDNAPNVTIIGGTFEGNAAAQPRGIGDPLIDDDIGSPDFHLFDAVIRNTTGIGARAASSRPVMARNRGLSTGHTAFWVAPIIANNPIDAPILEDNYVDRTAQNPDTMVGGCIAVEAAGSNITRPEVNRNTCRLPVPARFTTGWDQGAAPAYFNVLGIEVAGYPAYDKSTGNIAAHPTQDVEDAQVDENHVTGGGEGLSLCGIFRGSATGNVSIDGMYVGMEICAGTRDFSVTGGTNKLNDVSGGYNFWVTNARRVSIDNAVVISGGVGGIGYNYFVASGSIAGGSVTMRGTIPPGASSPSSTSGVTQESVPGMDDGGCLRVSNVGISGQTGYGMVFRNPRCVKVTDSDVRGATVANYGFIAQGVGTYFFTADNNTGVPAASGAQPRGYPAPSNVTKQFPVGSTLTGSYITGSSQPGLATRSSGDWYAR